MDYDVYVAGSPAMLRQRDLRLDQRPLGIARIAQAAMA